MGCNPTWLESDSHCFWYYDLRQPLVLTRGVLFLDVDISIIALRAMVFLEGDAHDDRGNADWTWDEDDDRKKV